MTRLPASARVRPAPPGLLAVAGLLLGVTLHPNVFAPAAIVGFLFGASLPIGCAVLAVAWRLTGGGWGSTLARVARPAMVSAWTVPILALPLLFGLGVYPWWNQTPGPEIEHRQPWMAGPWVIIRGAVCVAAWTVIPVLLARPRSAGQAAVPTTCSAGSAALAVIALLLTVTFASIDWVLALQTPARSSVFGLHVFMILTTNAMAGVTLAAALHARRTAVHGPRAVPDAERARLRDLGAILLAALALDFYLALSQFLVDWNGNLPGPNHWHKPRMHGGWAPLSVAMILLRYAIPIAALVSRTVKRSPAALATVSAIAVLGGILQAAWLVLPSVDARPGAGPVLLVLASLAAVAAASLLVVPLYAAALTADPEQEAMDG